MDVLNWRYNVVDVLHWRYNAVYVLKEKVYVGREGQGEGKKCMYSRLKL